MKKKTPKIFLISSPSGGGEDSVIEGLAEKIPFNRVITTVTRPMLLGESQGKPYYFISVQEFKKLLDKKVFIEWAIVYDDYRGCAKKEIKRLLALELPIVWKLDWQGVKTVKKLFPQAIGIFIAPPSYESLKKRLIKRGRDSMEGIKRREKFTRDWLKQESVYDYVVTNHDGKLLETISEIIKIIKKEINT